MPSARFPPTARLHDDRDYSRVFNRQQKAPGAHLLVLLRPQQSQASPVPRPRLGVMVSVKTAPSAVRRHQLKRWVREHFRLTLQHLPRLQGWDLVVLFRRDPPVAGHTALNGEISDLVERALAASPRPKPRDPRHGPRRG